MASQAALGKTLLAESKYEEAIEQYSLALKASPTSPDYLVQRSTAYQRTKKYSEALNDAEAAVIHATARAKKELITQSQLRRGIALFLLERYGDAKFALELVRTKDPKEKSVAMWLAKTETKLNALAADDEKGRVTIVEMPEQKKVEPSVELAGTSASSTSDANMQKQTQSTTSQPTPAEKIRHEWYQSTTNVFVSLLAKGVPKDKTTVELAEGSISIQFPIESTGKDYDFTLDPLFAAIDTAKSSYKILPTKIDITLVKATPGQKWSALEGNEPIATNDATVDKPAVSQAVLTQPAAPSKGPAYPTSSKTGPKDWDKIGADEADIDDVSGGDEAMKFFKKLYKDASPETQRAMMKSFSESNGTALSTNWEEVSKGKVETSPPDGMEAKSW